MSCLVDINTKLGSCINQKIVIGLTIAFSLCTLIGCGSGSMSQADLMKYGISRSSGDDEEEDQAASVEATTDLATEISATSTTNATPAIIAASEQPSPTNLSTSNETSINPSSTALASPRPGGTSPAVPTSNDPTSNDPASNDPASPDTGGVKIVESTRIDGLAPIAERKIAMSLTADERRQRAIDNLQAVSTTLSQWIERDGLIRPTVLKNSKGRPVLSWRVELLPMLGYPELYKRFDREKPWNMEPNLSLLQYIPDEFLSPERFDETTNIQLMVGNGSAFSETTPLYLSEVSDSNVLMLVEADDEAAVPWTAPTDYSLNESPLNRSLGNLRDDGVFVAWLDGFVSVWQKPIKDDELLRALSYDRGDQFNAARHTQYPKLKLSSGVSNSFASSSADSGSVSSPGQLPPQRTNLGDANLRGPALEGTIASQPIPSREEILESEKRLRETYQTMFQSARTSTELTSLANLIVQQLTTGATPGSDLYVGLKAALNIAIRAGNPKLAIKIVNSIDERFEVARGDFESLMVDGFLGDKGSLRTNVSEAIILLPTIEDLVSVEVAKDDFRAADKTLQMASLVIRQVSDRETAYRWKILKERVDEGKRLLPRVAKHLDTLRDSPDSPDANQVVGWYLCLIKDQWGEGLSMLAKSNVNELREIAQLEMQSNDTPQSHVRLGDSWWDYASDHKEDELAFEASMRRARKWYQAASVGLADGLDRIRANNRLSSIDRLVGKDPDATAVPPRSL